MSNLDNITIIEGDFSVQDAKFTILVGRFNHFITESLLKGAVDTLVRHGVKTEGIEIIRVPGAYELPMIAKKVAETRKPDAVIALGAVIRGGTPHFDFVAGECAKGIATVSLDSGVPMAFGVLTTDSIEQAIERAGTKAGNKGEEAAMTVLEMVSLYRTLDA